MIFAKGYRVVRLWGVEEVGSFPTLERSSQGSVLKKTLPRTFGPANPHFTTSRGVVLSHIQTGEEVRCDSFTQFSGKSDIVRVFQVYCQSLQRYFGRRIEHYSVLCGMILTLGGHALNPKTSNCPN